ncbi:MAG TPA: hypothetical protein VN764_03360, partial [Polyangiaceae bacterium]|nr:hypothetical protein [Polyangiaceae bacterium]
ITCDEDGREICDCSVCPDFSPVEDPTVFSACGGEPFGMWRLKETDWSPYKLNVTDQGTCEVSGVVAEEGHDFRLSLKSGGDLEMASVGSKFEFSVRSSCAGPCSGLYGNRADIECESTACGVCDCKMDLYEEQDEGKWERTDTELTLEMDSLGVATVPYCVEGGAMKLFWFGRILTFEQVAGTGVPQACSERTEATCRSGGGCRLGVCTGDGECDVANSETECLTVAGCSWDSSVCSGQAASECAFYELGIVPGCEFTDKTTCGGTPPTCTSIEDDEQCEQTPGCEVGRSCVGGTVDCGQVSTHNDQEDCEAQPGCSWYDIGGCEGEYACEDSVNITQCDRPDIGCIQATCRGEATPCDELDAFTCESVSGCSLR